LTLLRNVGGDAKYNALSTIGHHTKTGPSRVSNLAELEKLKRTIIDRHVKPSNAKGLFQVANTLVPLAALWTAVAFSPQVSYWLTAVLVVMITFLQLRVFIIMHECGHSSLFKSSALNKAFGFVFGLLTGMPQYVWAQRHHYHHSTNGNWSKYQGPLNIITVDKYAAMTQAEQRKYRNARSIWLAPIAGLMYLLITPRITLVKGTISLVSYLIKQKIAQPSVPVKTLAKGYQTTLWASPQEYWHMFWNNVVLLSLWWFMAWAMGPMLFFVCYFVSGAVSGGGSILLFTLQHNFEHSYASGDEGWNYNQAAMEGTSYLVLPGWMNWMTANIAYHHIHHLSARIPNYCLYDCHKEYESLFTGVTRLRVSQVPSALKCILWNTQAGRIISIAEYERGLGQELSRA
jgi:acyl-lipid omega-6 desaturase (Delta-12 desaturase)